MEINLVSDRGSWDSWLVGRGGAAVFLQSSEWGEILRAEGKIVERLAVVKDGKTIAPALVVYQELPGGWRYAFCPKGPVAMNFESRILNYGYELLAQYLRKRRCIFWRIEPERLVQDSSLVPSGVEGFKIQKTIDVTPRATTILDLTKSQDTLLAAMREKTRYNIRLAERKGVLVTKEKNFDEFMRLLRATGRRDAFRLHHPKHYESILASEISLQFNALYNNTIIATIVGIGFGDTFTYVFGASDYQHRSLMAPHLLQWAAIKFAKREGYKRYDFFGIAPRAVASSKYPVASIGEYQYDPHHPYAGITRFKLGFGGSIHEDPGTYDLIISPGKYKMYQLLRKLRRLF